VAGSGVAVLRQDRATLRGGSSWWSEAATMVVGNGGARMEEDDGGVVDARVRCCHGEDGA